MKKFVFTLVLALVLTLPKSVLANNETVICPQPYGGGVVCGVKTHEPINTGLGENLALVGSLALGASGVLLSLSRKFKARV
ncbi:MAG TPA: hypothetical protein VFI61_02150 [Patescibacteria group bacterium]|nr:hypothetical protein [Patescibacteria group bacterium]